MKILKKIALPFSLFYMSLFLALPASALVQDKVPIINYHHFTKNPTEVNSMTITEERFRQDMDYLKAWGYTPLTSADLMNIRAGSRQMPQKPIMITMDDGYASNYTIAFPILKERNLKATIAVITSHIKENPEEKGVALSWEQLKEMYESGVFDVGSHTMRLHNEDNEGELYPKAPNGIQRFYKEPYPIYHARVGQDLKTSIVSIQKHLQLNRPVYYFSYPFGITDPWMGKILIENKIFVSTTTYPRVAYIAKSLYNLPRFTVTMDRPISQILKHSETATMRTEVIEVNNHPSLLPVYHIQGSNYVRIRDFAWLMQHTHHKLRVGEKNGMIDVQTNLPYLSNGTELSALTTGNQIASTAISPILWDGVSTWIPSYTIQNEMYFSLRHLTEKAGLQIQWNEKTRNIRILEV